MKAKVMNNLEDLAGIIGTFQGIAEGANDERVVQELLSDAQKRVLDRFNADVAKRARAVRNFPQNLNHMYEFGVAGITPGKAFTADATSPEARLWTFVTVPHGRSVETVLHFRDAIRPNPKPKERFDLRPHKGPHGRDQSIVAKMSNREYVFKRRAEMTEYAREVNIQPTNAKALIFPSNEENEHGFGWWRKEWGPMQLNLGGGSSHKMKFTTYFMGWWQSKGEALTRESAHNSMTRRIGNARKAAKQGGKMKPARATNIAAAAKKAQEEAKKNMRRELGL